MDPVMTIFPDASEVKEVAKLLLELADHPSQVSTTLDPGLGFVVPEWLFVAFREVWDLKLGKDAVPAPEAASEIEASPEPAEPARRKPGRPRKES